ncbi:MAG: bifunctional diaminohydroxyphosphoribosylaminopyrimidine deaminase/5-amino-6-(5-phosphoribosylamino)uracil reductase RibD [Armatimonadetes bacterium]|nr:bifunctional diaminohydroxyphosphoribosylaminopyrimidine deaminase/5-amino-6-(5-phosphoribosylamino)uracil reductase RibD [Armatimonadota bacterium]
MGESRSELMRRAVELSRGGFPAPNPHVGCVIVADGEVVGEGFHHYAGGDHAEVVALRSAGERARGAEMYVTLEPCTHHGRTPPCTDAIIAAGVRRVVVAVLDPNPSADGGVKVLRDAGIECEVGLLGEEATEANRVFIKAHQRQRSTVYVKAAVTVDGFIANQDGSSKWITAEDARAEGHRLRAQMGCVLIGRETAEIDNPMLTARIPEVVNQPLRVVLDPNRKLKDSLRVFDSETPALRVVRPGLGGESTLEVEHTHESGFDLDSLLGKLFERGVIGVLVEGGGETIASFLRAGLVDEVHLFRSPKEFGKGRYWLGESPPLVKLNEVRRTKLDVDEYVVCEIVERAVEQSP